MKNNMKGLVGGPLLVGGLGPGPPAPPLNPALGPARRCLYSGSCWFALVMYGNQDTLRQRRCIADTSASEYKRSTYASRVAVAFSQSTVA